MAPKTDQAEGKKQPPDDNAQNARLDALEASDTEQNERLDALERGQTIPPAPDEDARLDALEASDAAQNTKIAAIEAAIAALQTSDATQNTRLDALEAGTEPGPEPPEPLPDAEDLVVELALPSGTLTFAQAEATDLGDYIGEFVHQRCLVHRQGAWTVFFRPDADGQRQEIVVEYGAYDFSQSPTVPVGVAREALWFTGEDDPPPQPQPDDDPAMPSPDRVELPRVSEQQAARAAAVHILQPYTATIKQGDATLATVTVPKHWWAARWRWCSKARPVVRSHDDLVAMKAILLHAEEALLNNPPDLSLPAAVWAGPMSTGGLTVYMPTTGDRQEIGPITNLQGSYLLRGNPEALTGLLAQAEAVGSWPFWIRDIATNNLLDVFLHPYQGFGSTASASLYPKLAAPAPANEPTYFYLDTSHMPAVAYVPWLLTDDPYFLEGVQMQAVFAITEHNYHQLNANLPGLANPGQKRGWAWGMRSVFQMAALAPESAPGWLHPRDYFRRMVADNLNYAQRFMASQIKPCRIFNMMTNINSTLATFEESYLLMVLGWARWTREFPEWDDAIDWMGVTLLRMTDDPALGGWDRRWPSPYRVYMVRARTMATNLALTNENIPYNSAIPEKYHDETPDSWAEFWELFLLRETTEGTPVPPLVEDKIYEKPGHYLEMETAAICALAHGGVPEAQEHAEWMRPEVIEAYAPVPLTKSSFRHAYPVPG